MSLLIWPRMFIWSSIPVTLMRRGTRSVSLRWTRVIVGSALIRLWIWPSRVWLASWIVVFFAIADFGSIWFRRALVIHVTVPARFSWLAVRLYWDILVAITGFVVIIIFSCSAANHNGEYNEDQLLDKLENSLFWDCKCLKIFLNRSIRVDT